jgi:hypothetical protein
VMATTRVRAVCVPEPTASSFLTAPQASPGEESAKSGGRTLKVASLFSGCGALDLGLQQAGHEVRGLPASASTAPSLPLLLITPVWCRSSCRLR